MTVQVSETKICERMSSLPQQSDDDRIDVRGHLVRGAAGKAAGKVEDMLLDPESLAPRFLEVSTGGIFGVAAKHHLLPIELVSSVGEDVVEITIETDALRESPEYLADRAPEEEMDVSAEAYSHFGIQPYWSEGYQAPRFPPA